MPENCPFDISPYTQSEMIKSPNIFNLNYTNQDFWSMKTRLIDYIKQQFEKEFNDFVESDLAIMLIENWSFLADTLSFKIDQIANEIFIDTVVEVENAFRLSKLVGFTPQPPIASRAMFTATINNPILTDVVVPSPLPVDVNTGGNSITYELYPADSDNNPLLDDDIIIPAGNIVNASVVGLEGKSRSQQVDGTGAPGYSVALSSSPVIFDSIRVKVDGTSWSEVNYFTDSQPRREFRVEFNSNYEAFVIFGNNRAGLIPSTGSKIIVNYRQGGGVRGNIISGFVETQTIVNVPGLEFSIPVSFRNYTKGEFGYDGDDIEDVRRKLPSWLRTQLRAVTGLDYKTLADQFVTSYHGQVGKSTAVLRHHGCAGNVIDLYILALNGEDGLQDGSNELKAALSNELDMKRMFTDFVCIRNGFVVSVDVSIDVIIDKFYRKFEDEYRERISRRIDRFFSLNSWEYNQDLRDVDLIKELSDIREVNRYESTFVTDDPDNTGQIITTKFNEIIRPDTIDISFSYE
jgi:hypothetical protein